MKVYLFHFQKIATSEVMEKRCDVCRVTYKGIMQYMEHIQGKKHVKNVRDKMSGSFMVRVEPFEFS